MSNKYLFIFLFFIVKKVILLIEKNKRYTEFTVVNKEQHRNKQKKEKKKYEWVADVAQQECNNNKYSASAYIYIFINGIQFQVFYWTGLTEFIGNLEPILK